MNLLKISWSNIKHRPMNTALSIVLLAFGIGIISLMILLKNQISEKFDRNIKDIDFVLAAKGSPLQSILANVYHVDAPTGNIKVADAKKIIRNPMVLEAIPLAYGDNYEKYRIVGTNQKYPEHYGCVLSQGKMFETPFEVTIGSAVAAETGLKVGSTFTSVHGFDKAAEGDADAHHHDKPFTVVGIFETSNSAIDNLILTPVESTWLVHEHGDEEATASIEPSVTADTLGGHNHAIGEAHDADEDREMTAYLIKKRNKGAFGMLSKLAENTTMQLANVAVENSRLMNNFGIGLSAISAIAIVITILSFVSIFISLFNSMKDRKYELALMRTMGGTRGTLFTLIIQEGLLLVTLGFALGLALSRIGLLILSNTMKDNFHYGLDKLGITSWEVMLFGITLLIGIVASLLPAIKALRIDISKTLSNA
jgi:putative ABC transport system permease protein